MDKSESINELATALSKFQGEITDVYKDKKGYGYNYADLSAVLELARPLLFKHGLAVTQLCGNKDEKISVETVLTHASGQWISGEMAIEIQQAKGMTLAQSCGSVISYMRRYALAALLGIAQTDNDASDKVEHIPRGTGVYNAELNYKIIQLGVPPHIVKGWIDKAGTTSIDELTNDQCVAILKMLKEKESRQDV